ncbi:MAG: hypothetical protein KatS3mg002_0970 [Candidatus Woesearchaeota archaeon]|nr:MAG: hypothetical protein KatS3mg002_0970 [Candidatus Woesearchaeota archaeon]
MIVEFKIKERNLTSLVADLSQLTNNPVLKQVYKNTIIPLSSCGINISENINFYDCKVRGISLNVNKNSILINVTALDSSGNKVTEQLEKSFTIDNIIPNVKIFTDYCNNDICYVKNGINKLIFELSKDNFEKKQIFFSIAETSGRVVNCTGNQCIGFANINCNGPLEIRILTSNPTSQDDSGNRLPSYSRKLLCDNSIPQITGVNWSSNNQLGENLLITGATINLEVDVNELDSGVIANAYFDLIKNETINAVCTNSTGNLFMCKWVVSPIREGYYDANVIINVSDLVNNTITRTEKVRILGFKSDNLTPSNLMASLTKTVPSRLNRAVLKLAEFNKIPVYAHAYYSVSVKQGVDVQLLSQDLSVDDCVIKLKNQDIVAASLLFSEIKIVDKYKGIGNDHRIDFTFATSSGNYNIFEDDTRVLCNISAYVREGKYVYKKPQILIIEIPFQLRNSQLDAPGEEYVKKIKDIEKSTTSDYSMLIANLDSFMTKAQRYM